MIRIWDGNKGGQMKDNLDPLHRATHAIAVANIAGKDFYSGPTWRLI
jgi:hypothetical protein